MMRDFCAIDSQEIELNNTSGLYHIDGRPHRLGPLMNVYNERTLGGLAARGRRMRPCRSNCPGAWSGPWPPRPANAGVGVEVQVFGRASLAVSARCYHARAHCRTKDNCQFVCEEDPDGMPLTTVTDQSFLVVNGIQTLSHSYLCLAAEIDEMRDMGVSHFRVLPQRADMVAVTRIFADRIAGRADGAETLARLEELNLPAPLSNGFWHGAEGHRHFGPRAA
ncbi:U32 family peptidase [Jhaorihella thermophila]